MTRERIALFGQRPAARRRFFGSLRWALAKANNTTGALLLLLLLPTFDGPDSHCCCCVRRVGRGGWRESRAARAARNCSCRSSPRAGHDRSARVRERGAARADREARARRGARRDNNKNARGVASGASYAVLLRPPSEWRHVCPVGDWCNNCARSAAARGRQVARASRQRAANAATTWRELPGRGQSDRAEGEALGPVSCECAALCRAAPHGFIFIDNRAAGGNPCPPRTRKRGGGGLLYVLFY